MKNKNKLYAGIAGVSLIIMAILAGFAYGYAHNNLVEETAGNTLINIIENKSLFWAELMSWTLIFITDIIVAGALFFFFRETNKNISLLTAAIRVVYTIVLGFAIFELFKVIPLISDNNAISNHQIMTETSSYLLMFEKLWSIGLIIFGFHLIGLGYLSLKSKAINNILGYLLYFAGISYTFLHTAFQFNLFNEDILKLIENILALPMALAEILLAFWLIYFALRKSTQI